MIDINKIYIVDDEQIVIDQFWARRRFFFESGFEICGASTNSLTAVGEIRSMRPDVVFSDLKMPGLNGAELMDEISRDVLKPLFVIISAHGDYKYIRKFFLTRGFDYLLKPVTDCELIDLLNRLAEKLNCAQPVIERQTPSAKLDEILYYLNERPGINHSLDFVAERFKINRSTLCALFSKHLKTTFSSYINELRMERARTLLSSTDKLVKEIAVHCGFSDALYFTRVFHKTHNISPTRFREEARRTK
ncbi:MAG: helix-turn-helix domain-containing protein [Oscillospiraceae bacterium]|nr:helix-turn-helix domain-containing protein [Oscillospiraceae bacterium]